MSGFFRVAASPPLCSAFTLFAAAAKFCSSAVSASARCRWACRVSTRWRARPPLMLTLQKLSEPRLQWRKAQMDSGLATFGCPETSFFAAPACPMKELDGVIRDRVWVSRTLRNGQSDSLPRGPCVSDSDMVLHGHIWTQGTPLKTEEAPLRSRNDTPSFIPRFRLACVAFEFLLHAGKQVVKASSAPILSAESAVHGTKASPWCSQFLSLVCVSLSVVRVCLATWCGPVYLRSWRCPSSVLCLLGRAQQGFRQEPKSRGSTVAEPTGFFFVSLPHVLHASVGCLENGVSPQAPRTFCASTCICASSARGDFFDLPLFLNFSLSMALVCHVAIICFCEVCFGLQQWQTNEI